VTAAHPKEINIPEDPALRKALIKHLEEFLTENKRQRFDEVLPNRTRHVTVVVEDIYQPHNASATMRSCDLFGIQDLHVIENHHRYSLNPGVSVGASKWVTLHRWNQRGEDNTMLCLDDLKSKGYRVVATTPHENDILLPDLPVDQPFALVFGTEQTGLSQRAIDLADDFVKIPMVGFTESFNISVSVALCLYDVMHRLWRSEIDWKIPPEEHDELRLTWLQKAINKSPALIRDFLAGQRSS
jgi:tRNA (guanosine-2'-O-)-methyltransferase